MFDEYHRRTWEDTDHDISEHQNELATSLRVPILTSSNTRWNYITGIVVSDRWPDHGIMPTDDEIRLVGKHIASYNTYYNPRFRDVMERFAPYDIDGAANLGYYMKRPSGGWCYRKRTWRSVGYWPALKDQDVVLPLSHVLARNFGGWPWIK